MKNTFKLFICAAVVSFQYSCKDNEVADISPINKEIRAIAIHNNEIWIGTSENGVYKKEGKTWINFSGPNEIASNKVMALAISEEGTVWVGTDLGISKYENGAWTTYTEADGLYSNKTYALGFDNQNNLLIGNANNRFSIFDGSTFSTIHVNQEIAGNAGHIHAVTIDSDGNIWIGSCSTGLSMFNGQFWAHAIDGRNVFVSAILCAQNGDIWVADPFGAHKLHNHNWISYNESDGLVNNYSLCFTEDQQNNIWVGSTNGLSKFNGTSWSSLNISNGAINALACDLQGNIWVGGSGLTIIAP